MPMKLKNMKGIDIFCASPASTAICSSTDQRSMVRNGTKSIQRLNSYLGDHYKTLTNNIYSHSPSRAPCNLSELPFTPRPSSFASYREKTHKLTSAVKHSDVITRRKSSADVSDFRRYDYTKYSYEDNKRQTSSRTPAGVEGRWSHSSEAQTPSRTPAGVEGRWSHSSDGTKGQTPSRAPVRVEGIWLHSSDGTKGQAPSRTPPGVNERWSHSSDGTKGQTPSRTPAGVNERWSHSSETQTPRPKRSSGYERVEERWSHKYEDNNSHSSRYLLGESKFLDSLYEENERINFSTKTASTFGASSTEPSTPVFGAQGRKSCASRVETNRFGSMLDEEKEKIRKHFSLIDVSDQPRGVNEPIRNKINSKVNGDETRNDGHYSQRHNSMGRCRNDSLVQKSSSCAKSRDQVVVLRVSLHCKGCEGKLRKHLSKMEGVTSFSIDLETKKVTVIGKVTPLDVLTSISKVKNAQFWPTPASSSSTSSSSRSSTSTSSSSIVEYN